MAHPMRIPIAGSVGDGDAKENRFPKEAVFDFPVAMIRDCCP
jgi:hypothetical protein